GHRRRLLLLLGRWRRRRRGRLARGWFGRRCLGAPRGCRRRRGFLCGTLLLQAARGLLLRALLIGQALALQFGAALGLLLGAQLFALLALGQVGAAVGDRLLQAWQRRMAGIGLLEQRVESLGLVEVVAADALLGRDQGIGLQVGQRAGHGRVVRLLVAQRQVVLHGVVAARRVQALLAQRLAGGVAQLVGAHGLDLAGDRGLLGGRGGGRGLLGPRGRGVCLVLLAAGEGAGDEDDGGQPDPGRPRGIGRKHRKAPLSVRAHVR